MEYVGKGPWSNFEIFKCQYSTRMFTTVCDTGYPCNGETILINSFFGCGGADVGHLPDTSIEIQAFLSVFLQSSFIY